MKSLIKGYGTEKRLGYTVLDDRPTLVKKVKKGRAIPAKGREGI
jgi:hypothetical protein